LVGQAVILDDLIGREKLADDLRLGMAAPDESGNYTLIIPKMAAHVAGV
jgi:hypothetical protein